MSHRFYCPDLRQPLVILDPEESHHLSRVCRGKVGDQVELFDGQGVGFVGEVVKLGPRHVEVQVITDQPIADRVGPREVTLGFAVPKGDRLDWLVEKATELGVTHLVPLECDRSVVEPGRGKLERLRRRCIEACKQSGRCTVPTVAELTELPRFLEAQQGTMHWFCHPAEIGLPIPNSRDSVTVAIGPEGGFTAAEHGLAVSAGWTIGSLGTTVLRVETAAIAALVRALI